MRRVLSMEHMSYSVHQAPCTIYKVQCAACTVYVELVVHGACTTQCARCTVCTVHSVHGAVCMVVQCAVFKARSAHCAMLDAVYSVQYSFLHLLGPNIQSSLRVGGTLVCAYAG